MLKMLRTSSEDIAARIATGGELGVVAVAAVDLVHLATELFIHQGHFALGTEEAGLMPVLILVRQILKTISDYVLQLFLFRRSHIMHYCRSLFAESSKQLFTQTIKTFS